MKVGFGALAPPCNQNKNSYEGMIGRIGEAFFLNVRPSLKIKLN